MTPEPELDSEEVAAQAEDEEFWAWVDNVIGGWVEWGGTFEEEDSE